MKRNIAVIICILLTASFLFASCGKEYYVDADGMTHVALTDKSGEMVTDKYGSVIVVATDENGDAVTDAEGNTETYTVEAAKINVDSSGKKINCNAYTMTVPNGWVLSPDNREVAQLVYGDENGDIKMEIRYAAREYDEVLKENQDFMKSFFVDQVEKVIINEEEEIKLKDGAISPVTKITFLGAATKDGKESTAGLIVYVFSAGTYTYSVPCNIYSEDDIKNIDFESVLNSIEYK